MLALLTPSHATVQSLDGAWRMRLDPQDAGINEKWSEQILSEIIQLPGTTDLAGFGEPEVDPNPGHLTRPHKYLGAAWYQRDIEIPATWRDREIELFLERVLWESRTWVDGLELGRQDSLGTPHIHNLGRLGPGKHTLTLRIDNRMIHPIGDRGHCYTEFTQSIWNGVVGKIELRALPPVRLGLIRVFPDAAARTVSIDAECIGGAIADAALTLRELPSGRIVAQGKGSSLDLPDAPKSWDGFSPNLYQMDVELSGDKQELTFGFRTIARDGNRLLINGRPSFMRGNMDCAQYPLTGHPPTGVEDWKRMYGTCQQYGINQIRFHSWCPPDAAFVAADEMGMYLQPEVLWIDGWMDAPNSRKDMDTPGYPKGVGKGDRTIDAYVRAEMRRMLDTYGNHPSFCFFAIGNELGSSNFEVMGKWIQEEKQRDPRRFYAASTARTITPADDFADTHNIPGIGGTVNRLGVPHTDWDYGASYGRAPLPVIAHEAGQMPVYPNWREIAKYTGPLRATGFELFREQARINGTEDQSAAFQQASGAMNRIIYKGEMEALLRSPGCSGVSWLSLQDFPGQGEALVGWLDTFYESKGIVSPEQFRRYSAPTVPLARFKKYNWTQGENLRATVQVAHWGADPITNMRARWTLRDSEGKSLANGDFVAVDLAVGAVTDLGEIQVGLAQVKAPQRVNLEIMLPGTPFSNDWDLWVFPEAEGLAPMDGVLVTDSQTEAMAALEKGGRVVLLAHKSGSPALAAWMPLFWSSRFFPGQNRDTLGALVQADHPALARFPTASHLDWQWWEICEDGRGFVLDDQATSYRPIVQPVSDYHFNHKLGAVFEMRGEQGGRLLVCGYNIVDRLNQRPAARQLRTSLLAYAGSADFNPTAPITAEDFQRLFPPPVPIAESSKAPGFENAVLYVRAGARHPADGNAKWRPEVDESHVSEGFGYTVKCDGVWKDSTGTAWWGGPALRVELKVEKPDLYSLYVHFHDWNDNGRTGTIDFEGRKVELGTHTGTGQWVKIDVLREDALDGEMVLEARCESGPNLQITAIALVPKTLDK